MDYATGVIGKTSTIPLNNQSSVVVDDTLPPQTPPKAPEEAPARRWSRQGRTIRSSYAHEVEEFPAFPTQ
jgi:hypothetical protein